MRPKVDHNFDKNKIDSEIYQAGALQNFNLQEYIYKIYWKIVYSSPMRRAFKMTDLML